MVFFGRTGTTMDATVIDTLRYANRLREAGVEPGQAEAMARAINDELSVGVATRDDLGAAERNLGHAVAELRSDMEHGFAKLRADMDHSLAELRGDLDVFKAEVTAKLDAQNGKFEAQGRYLFLTLAVIAALGLYNAAAPHFTGNTGAAVRSGDPPPTAPASAANTRPAP